jgi:hypothetical protein
MKCTFATSANPEDIFPREPAEQSEGASHLILMGGSNLGRAKTELTRMGFTVTDLTKPGWTPTDYNVRSLVSDLQDMELKPNMGFVMDTLGNTSHRYEQLDGSLSLPFKVGGNYHMGGEVKVSSWETTRNVITKLKPIMEIIPGHITFISPLPRYVYSSCCEDPEHCLKVNTSPYIEDLIRESIALTNVCSSHIGQLGIRNVTVTNTVQGMMPACSGIREFSVAYRLLAAADGVHLTNEGYSKLAALIKNNCNNGDELKTAASPYSSGPASRGTRDSSTTPQPSSYFWRGFISPVGTPRPKNSTERYHLTHGGGKWTNSKPGPQNRNMPHPHPYRGRGRRGR